MCGIAGWFNPSKKSNQDVTKLRRMSESIQHRGPDGNGEYVADHAALAHRRLAVIGLQTGSQPMTSQCGHVTISYNGEIYNYIQLSNLLAKQGVQTRTKTDTEVIINLYLTYGLEGFNKLRGMYAFALWDSNKSEGYLVRDPLGIKPLFYTTYKNDTVIFGSEAKAIIAYGIKAELSINSLHYLMNFRYLPGEKSMFSNITQIEPGQILAWSPARGIYKSIVHPNDDSIKYTNLNEALSDSICAHTVADVEVGSYLSGGIDSALITKTLADLHPEFAVKTFTLNVGDDPSEAKNASLSAEIFGVKNFQADFTCSNSIETLRNIIFHLEVPKVNAWQSSLVSKLAASKVKVALSGLGADELFFGYNAHQIFYLINILKNRFPTHYLHIFLKSILSKKTRWSEPLRFSEMLHKDISTATTYGLIRNCWDSPSNREWIYGSAVQDSELDNIFTWLNDIWPKNTEPLQAFHRFEWNNKLINDLLWQEDRLSMAEGLEIRTPYVDINLKKYVESNCHLKPMPFGKKKYYFKQSIRDILPNSILNRPKSGFQVHAGNFLQNTLNEAAEVYLSKNVVEKHSLFKYTFVNQIRNLPPNKKHRWHYFMLYLIIGVHMWKELYENESHLA